MIGQDLQTGVLRNSISHVKIVKEHVAWKLEMGLGYII
jgi:hypothetical protein